MKFLLKNLIFLFFIFFLLFNCKTSDKITDNKAESKKHNKNRQNSNKNDNSNDFYIETKNIYFLINISNNIKFNDKALLNSDIEKEKNILENTDDFYIFDDYLSSFPLNENFKKLLECKDSITNFIKDDLFYYNEDFIEFQFIEYMKDLNVDTSILLIKIYEINEGEYSLIKFRPTIIAFNVILIDSFKVKRLLFKKKIKQNATMDFPLEKDRLENSCFKFSNYLINYLVDYYYN